MSEIDQYDHRCLGIVVCPSSFVQASGAKGSFALYRFDSDSTDPLDSFQAKRGDIIMGGGHGEGGTFRMAVPEIFLAFTDGDWDNRRTMDQLAHAYWSINQAFIHGEGFIKVGWHPASGPLETWLSEHIMAFLVRVYPGAYAALAGPEPIEQDGSICRLPTEDERRGADWKHYR